MKKCSSIEGDFRRFLRHVNVLEMRSVKLRFLLLHCCAKLQKFLWNVLLRLSQHVDKLARTRLVHTSEERDTSSSLARASRSANAMHVVFRREREGVVDDKLDVRDVQTTARDVRGHEDANLIVLEALDGIKALTLALITVHARAVVPSALQELLEAHSLLLVEGEDDDAMVRRRP